MKKLNILLLSMLVPVFLHAQTGTVKVQAPGSVVIRKCVDFQVTGNGSSDMWNKTDWLPLVPQGSNPSTYKTAVKVLYSETGIYFLFDCQDKKLTSTMQADNLNLWEEDVVELFLWTSEDFPVYFEYEVSPMNYELPIIIPNYKGSFLGWLPWKDEWGKGVRHETSVTGGEKKGGASVKAWMAEIFIPYKLLAPLPQVPPVSGTRWRANMYRIDYDNGPAHFAWQKTGGSYHEYNNFGTFVFE